MGSILTSYYKQQDADCQKSSETTKKTEEGNKTPEKVRTSKKSISYYPSNYKKRKNTKKNK